MKNKSPAFQFYPSDFLSDENVISMTFEERGVYITLLSNCWIQGSIPADQDKIKRLLPGYNGDGIPEQVMECFQPMEDNPGRLVHNRLEKERLKQDEWKEKCSAGGRKSAEIRQKKQDLKGSPRVVDDKLVVKSNSMSSSSSLSSSSKNKQEVSNWEKTKQKLFETAWSDYPGTKDGKKAAMRHWNASIKKPEDIEKYVLAIANYRRYVKNERNNGFKDLSFKNGSTWFNNWQDYYTPVEEQPEPPPPEPKARVRGDPETEKLWEDALEKIKGTISAGAFDNWFKGTYPRELANGTLMIAAPDQLNRNCLIENYTLQIEGVLMALTENPILVDFCIDRDIG